MANRKRSAGFTLTEMLVVIAIVALLAALLFPVFNRAREASRQGKCMSNLNQINNAVHQFKRDKGRYPKYLVVEFTTNPPTVRTVGGKQVLEVRALSELYPDYVSSVEPFICPNDLTRDPSTQKLFRELAVADVVLPQNVDPNQKIHKALIYSSYAGPAPGDSRYWNYNGYLPNNPDGVQDPTTPPPPNSPFLCVDDPNYVTAMNNAGITSGSKVPRLCNRQAPDYTIVAHCRFHRDQTNNEILVRLGGTASKSVKFTNVNNQFVTEYNWTLQPE